jgi:NAD(P)-dependent dehydrogenase (short-subunit alcohol dehydrogenase family)
MKNYLVVGHSSGIGKALSEKLSEKNNVFGTYYKNQPSINQATLTSHYLNVLDEQPNLSFLPDVLDGLAYCPGAINLKPFARLKEEDFINDFRLQVSGAIKIIQACLPNLKKAENPSIVLFSTVAVQMGFNFHSLVSTSKGAIEGLTKALAAEFAPKIRVNCIAPSITQTPLAQNLLNTPEKIEANAQRHPLKKIGSPEDIANMAAFLLREESTWMSGQILHIDGGISSIKL